MEINPRGAPKEVAPRIDRIVLGGTSKARAEFVSKYLPGIHLDTVEMPDEPNHDGSIGVVRHKLDRATSLTEGITDSTFFVAGDIMVSRVTFDKKAKEIVVNDNNGKYDDEIAILNDIRHMMYAYAEHPSIPPFFRIQSASGVKLGMGKPTFSDRNYMITLDPLKVSEFLAKEMFAKYVAEMEEKMGEGALRKIAGGLEIGYLLEKDCVTSINGVSRNDGVFDEMREEALHYGQIGIDPALLQRHAA